MAIGNFFNFISNHFRCKNVYDSRKVTIFLRLNGKVGKEVEFNFKKNFRIVFNDNIFVWFFYNNNCLISLYLVGHFWLPLSQSSPF